jgi:sporulation protein YlmC with PRC-barrel domain
MVGWKPGASPQQGDFMKSKTFLSLWTGVAMLGLTAATLQAQNSADSSSVSQGQLGKIQATRHYMGKDVKTQDGEKVGKVEDFVVDLESGRILYGVVNANGSSRGLPIELMKPSADQNSFTINSDKQHVNNAPAVPKRLF